MNSVEELARADWTKLSEDKLPAYKTPAFFGLLDRLGVSLDEFRQMPVYRHAVDVRLIVDDEWASVDVSLTTGLASVLWTFLADLQGKQLYTPTGVPFTVVDVQPESKDAAITVKLGRSRKQTGISHDGIEDAAELWLGGGVINAENMRKLAEILGKSYKHLLFIAAIFTHVEPRLADIVIRDVRFHMYPVYERLILEAPGSMIGSPRALDVKDYQV